MRNLISSVKRLSNPELLTRVKYLARRERESTAIVIAHLAELEARRLFLPEGCSSMFTYCTQVLCYSESAAYWRISAARAARKFPVILDRLSAGSVNLTSIALLASHLTPDNHRDILDEAGGKTRRQVEEMVARLRPLPPVAPSIRKLPAPGEEEATPPAGLTLEIAPPDEIILQRSPDSTEALQTSADAGMPSPGQPMNDVQPPSHRAVILPLSPEYYRLQVTLRAETHVRLRQAQELMRHQIPNGDPAEIFDRALKDLVEKLSRRKFAALTRPRTGKDRNDS